MFGHLDSDEDLGINRSIFENSLDAILLTKPDSTILAANPMAEKMFDMTEEDLKTAGRDGIVVKVDNLISEQDEQVKKGRFKAEITFKRKDGTTFPGEVTSTLFTDENGVVKIHMIITDISGRKQAEKALIDSEENYRHLLQYAPTAIYEIDFKGPRFKSVNDAMCQLSGYSREELLSTNPLDLLDSESQERFQQRIRKGLAGEEIDEKVDYTVIHKDGRKLWVTLNIKPTYTDGKIDGALVVGHDITERKKAEDALHESEGRYRSILDNIQDAYMRGNNEGVITMVSPSAARMYGFDSPQEMIGVPNLWLYKNPEDRNYVLKELKKHGKMEDYECEGLRTDGTSFSVSMNAQFHYDEQGQIQGTEAFVREITERKKAEEALNQSQKLLQDIINGSPSPIFVKDIEGRFLTINNKLEELLGVKNEELKGKTDYDIITKELADYYRVNDQKVLEEGKALLFEEEADLIDGHHIFIANKFPIYDINDKPYGVGSISTDITERKLLEEKVQKRTDELAKSNADLKQFAYVASHDLREPLRMISSFLQLLERRYKDKLDEDANEFIGFAVEGAKRLDIMIMDLLEYSRVANKETQYTDVDLELLIDKVLSNLNVLIKENNAQITYDSLPTIWSDENLMVRLFQNLINNAIKYRREQTPQIDISAEKEGDKYVFSVKDNGIGIEPQHLERIFTIFNRLHTHQEYEGSGIGLSIAQRIVHQHGGEIWAESQPGQGSTFYFTIPET